MGRFREIDARKWRANAFTALAMSAVPGSVLLARGSIWRGDFVVVILLLLGGVVVAVPLTTAAVRLPPVTDEIPVEERERVEVRHRGVIVDAVLVGSVVPSVLAAAWVFLLLVKFSIGMAG